MRYRDDYAAAKRVRTLAATARRTATATKYVAGMVEGLSQKDQDALQRAAEILSTIGSRMAQEAKAKAKVEAAQLRTEQEARAVIRMWPRESALDSLAIVVAMGWGNHLVSVETLTASALDVDHAIRNGASHAAFETQRSRRSLSDVLAEMRREVEAAKCRADVIARAAQLAV